MKRIALDGNLQGSPLPPRSAGSRGVALVVVLSVLVILVILVVAFLGRTGTERAAAATYAANVGARNLADVALNLVQAQINDATTLGSDYAWASQPGMVRTFDTTGQLYRAYKLYSAPDMMASTVDLTSDIPPSDWKSRAAGWIDLNEPVASRNGGSLSYPILDPAAQAQTGTVDAVEGFKINSSPGYAPALGAAPDNNPAPMPVRWLYVLKNGQLTIPSSVSATSADFSGATVKPSASNPIVGRLAFWTDDESCKVNINTAGEGTYWDTPRADSDDERNLGNYQPSRNEWQRYPGHPATTSLSAVFPWLGVPSPPTEGNTVQRALLLAPRYSWGGSEAGTKARLRSDGYIMPTKNEPLRASVDEMILDRNRGIRDFSQDASSTASAVLRSRRFFLTSHSRAPETNLFNLPRISIWPIYRKNSDGSFDMNRSTGFDRQIALCSTVNGKPYFFQRENADSATNDWDAIERNRQLYAYLRELTGRTIPGFGGNFSAKYADDRDQILTEILDYIRCTNLYDDLLSSPNQFTNPRNANMSVADGHGYVTPLRHEVSGRQFKGFGRFHTVSEFGQLFICTADPDDPDSNYPPGSSPPSGKKINYTLSNGVPPGGLSSTQRQIQALPLLELFDPMHGWVPGRRDMRIRITGMDKFKIDQQSLGYGSTLTFRYRVSGNTTFKESDAGGISGFRTPLLWYANNPTVVKLVSNPVTVTKAATMEFTGGNITIDFFPPSGAMSDATKIQSVSIHFPDGTFPQPGLVSSGTPLVTITNDDPVSGREGKSVATEKTNWWGFSNNAAVGSCLGTDKGRLDYITTYDERSAGTAAAPGSGAIIRDGFDVVRTVYPAHGDYRLIAGRYDAPSGDFSPAAAPSYWSQSQKLFHYLSEGTGTGYLPGFDGSGAGGFLAPGVVYPALRLPDIPSAYTPANAKKAGSFTYHPSVTGDWDTGISFLPDGPFINKPDEGNTDRGGATQLLSRIPYFYGYVTQEGATESFFSPNRIMPSPGMFGSLSTGVQAGIPWRTLLFRPQSDHFGATSPSDHLMLDYFWMPVVEPYAISEPFSTAGKINLNCQILPFTYIERFTGLHALLKNERVGAIPNSAGSTYKTVGLGNTSTRMKIDIPETLAQFTDRFQTGIFRSASEICDLYMVPEGESLSDMPAFWADHALTGENIREKIYATLYPRITTKSNTFCVHMRTQNIHKNPTGDPLIFNETKDAVTGEYRGATVIERYVNPNNTAIPDYAANPLAIGTSDLQPLDNFYRWRIVQNRQFLP